LGDQALAIAPAYSKRPFDNMWNHDDSVSPLHESLRYALIRSLHNFGQDYCGLVGASSFVGPLMMRKRNG